MELQDTYGCCTATMIYNFGDFRGMRPSAQLNWLKTDRTLLKLSTQMNDEALIWSISVDEQDNEESFKALGFQHLGPFEKTHEESRETDTGSLHMWCIQPWVLNENRLKLIAELEEKLNPKISEEEISRRKTFDEFALFKVRQTDLYKDTFGQDRLYTYTKFPGALGARKSFFNLIQNMTGGFNAENDPKIVELRHAGGLTWGVIKERAIQYRNGEI